MAVAFGAAGTLGAASSGTSITPALPAGITAGQLLLGVVGTKNNATHTWPAGWTVLGQTNSGASWTVSVAVKIATGSDSAPVVSWSGSVANEGSVSRWTGNDTKQPIGFVGTAGTGSTSTHTSTGQNTTRNASGVIYIDASAANTALTTPGSFTSEISSGSSTSATHLDIGLQTIATQGTSSGNISTTGAAAAWVELQLEILSPMPEFPQATTIDLPPAQQLPRVNRPDVNAQSNTALLAAWFQTYYVPASPTFYRRPPNDDGRRIDPNAQTNIELFGQDTIYGALGQVATYDWPLPRGPIQPDRSFVSGTPLPILAPPLVRPPFLQMDWPVPALSMPPPLNRSWTWSTPIQLIGQDKVYGAPGEVPAYDWPLPRAPAQFIRTWVWNDLEDTLRGQDAVYGAPGEVPAYDWPVPKGPAQFIRTWLWNNLEDTLRGQDRIYGAPGQVPAYDWPVPKGPANFVRTWTWNDLEGVLAGQDRMYGAPGEVPAYDWPVPRGPAQFNRSWLWTLLPLLTPPTGMPFVQTDWPVPRGPAQFIRSWTWDMQRQLIGQDSMYGAPGQVPAFDWPLPQRGPAQPIRSWVWNDLTGLLLPLPIGTRYDLSLPQRPIYERRSWEWNWNTLYGGPPPAMPPFNYDWPVPRGHIYPVSLRTWIHHGQLIVPSPIEIAKRRVPPLSLRPTAPPKSYTATPMMGSPLALLASTPPRRLTAIAEPRDLTLLVVLNRKMSQAKDLKPDIDVGEQLEIGFDFGPTLAKMLNKPTIVASPAPTVTATVSTLSVAQDPAPQSRVLGATSIGSSEETGAAASQVNVLFGNCVGGVIYTIVCTAVTSDGQTVIDWTRWRCRQPN